MRESRRRGVLTVNVEAPTDAVFQDTWGRTALSPTVDIGAAGRHALASSGTDAGDLRRCLRRAGFIDARWHRTGLGMLMRSIGGKALDMPSVQALRQSVCGPAAASPPGRWMHTRHEGQSGLPERPHPR